jgi:hypothetical protein
MDHVVCTSPFKKPSETRRKAAAIVTGLLLLTAVSAEAQDTPQRVYRPNAADEDWTFLKNAPKSDRWDPVKYIELGPEDWSLSLSGEVRFRPEGFRVHPVADGSSRSDNYFLQRYLFGADARFGKRVRVFGELQSGVINGQLRSPRPTDRNSVDLHQAFVEVRQPLPRSQLTLVVGRQELEIGSSRLISASPGLNVKRSFDGAAVFFRAASWRVAAVAAQLVGLSPGVFDDRPDHSQLFWGVAAGKSGLAMERSQLGGYYLGVDRDLSLYVQGRGPERRHTFGANWNGGGGGFDLNYDAIFQWGSFNGASIAATAFATETGYRLPVRWAPRVSLRTDFATGDDDASDPSLQSFNPLFPGNAYSGAVGLFGPTNLTDVTPAITLSPVRRFTLGFEAPSYWRTSRADGIYATDLRVLVRPEAGSGKYIGTNPGIIAAWQATPHLQLQGAITRFLAGDFLENTFVANGFGFYSVTARYRF